MKRKLFKLLSATTLGGCLLFHSGCTTAQQNGSSLSRLSVIDSQKRTVHPFSHQEQATVLIFVATECPVSNKYAPEVSRLYSKFKDAHIAIYLVYPNVDDIPEMIQSHTKDYGYMMPALYDPQHKLVGPSKVRVTPEAAVFSKDGTLVYHGRIDDRFPSLGVTRPQSSVHDLEGILQALSEGKAVAPTETKAIGCYIPQ